MYVDNSDRWPEHFRGIGIRIEDSVCVGDDSPLVLTTEAVKEVSLSCVTTTAWPCFDVTSGRGYRSSEKLTGGNLVRTIGQRG